MVFVVPSCRGSPTGSDPDAVPRRAVTLTLGRPARGLLLSNEGGNASCTPDLQESPGVKGSERRQSLKLHSTGLYLSLQSVASAQTELWEWRVAERPSGVRCREGTSKAGGGRSDHGQHEGARSDGRVCVLTAVVDT